MSSRIIYIVSISVGIILAVASSFFSPLYFLKYLDLFGLIVSRGQSLKLDPIFGLTLFLPLKIIAFCILSFLVAHIVNSFKSRQTKRAFKVLVTTILVFILCYSFYFYETIYVNNNNIRYYELIETGPGNESYCDKMQYIYFKPVSGEIPSVTGCYYNLAINNSDIQICKKLPNKEGSFDRDRCLYDLAQKLNDASICVDIASFNKKICLNYFR